MPMMMMMMMTFIIFNKDTNTLISVGSSLRTSEVSGVTFRIFLYVSFYSTEFPITSESVFVTSVLVLVWGSTSYILFRFNFKTWRIFQQLLKHILLFPLNKTDHIHMCKCNWLAQFAQSLTLGLSVGAKANMPLHLRIEIVFHFENLRCVQNSCESQETKHVICFCYI
jgi:hypothetical protein